MEKESDRADSKHEVNRRARRSARALKVGEVYRRRRWCVEGKEREGGLDSRVRYKKIKTG